MKGAAMRLPTSLWLILLSLAAIPLAGSNIEAAYDHMTADRFDPLESPNQPLASYYATNRAEIDNLSNVAKDETAEPKKRLEALGELQNDYPDPAVAISVDLVKDKA